MITFMGLASVGLYVFFLGLLWLNKPGLSLGEAVWGYFVKALLLSWAWFFVSYFTPIGSLAPWLVALAYLAVIAVLFKRRTTVQFYKTEPLWLDITKTAVALVLLLIGFHALSDLPGTVFSEWDALVSWNRWGIELSENKYKPLTGAYPVIWPAIWSLIYEAQGSNDIWYFAKISAAAPAFFAFLFFASSVRSRLWVSSVILFGLVLAIYLPQEQYLGSGYMDIPLSLIGLVGLVLLSRAVSEPDPEKRLGQLEIAAITLGVSIMTKQGGVFFALLFCVTIAIYFFTRKMSFIQSAKFAVIIVLPVLSFLVIYSMEQPNILGNMDILNDTAAKARGDAGVIEYAVSVVRQVAPIPVFLVIGIGSMLNLVFFRHARNWLGLAAGAFAIFLFLMFADCCSYNERNSFMIFSLASFSAYTGFCSAEAYLAERAVMQRFYKAVGTMATVPMLAKIVPTLAFIGLALGFGASLPNAKITSLHETTLNTQVGSQKANAYLNSHRALIDNSDVLISYYQPLKFLPIGRDRYKLCHKTTESCVGSAFSNSDVESVIIFSAGWNENDASRKDIEALIRTGRLAILDQERPDGNTIYGATRSSFVVE